MTSNASDPKCKAVPQELEESARLISEFLEFARSRPSGGNIARALTKILSVPKHVAVTAALENALQEVRNFYPNQHLIELHLALLPSRNEDYYCASELLQEFIYKFPNNPWGYLHGIDVSRSANLYEKADRIASQALEYLDTLVPLEAAELYALLLQAGQVGRHPLFFELYRRCGALLSEIPAHRARRFACVANNLRTEVYKRIAFVSLGTNCLPWTVGNRWGFRPSLGENKHQLPLNFALLTAPSCGLMLGDRFGKLSESSQYVLTRGPYGFDIALHKGYRFMFNHEIGQYWLSHACENLVRRYKERVANFFEYATAGPRVYVLYLPWNLDVGAIEERIAELSADGNYRLLVIDARAVADDTGHGHSNTIWRKVSLPSINFVWHRAFDTEEGVRFEAAIHDAMRDAASELMT